MTQPHTSYVAVQAPGPHRITVETGQSEAEWFRVFNWYVDDIMPDLSGAAVKVMNYICRHADRYTRICDRPQKRIAEDLRLAKGTVSTEVKGLLAHPAGLLAECGASFAPFPGHVFAGRILRPPDDPPVRLIEPEFARPNLSLPNRTAVMAVQGNARASKDQNQEKDIIVEKSDDDDAVRLLTEAGFNATDARRLIARTQADLETVRTAVANTRYKASIGDLRNARGYIARQLQNGCTLFSAIQQRHDAAIRNRDRLARLIEAFGTPDDAADAQAWFYGLSTSEQATAIRGFEARMGDADLWRAIRPRITQARQRAGGAS